MGNSTTKFNEMDMNEIRQFMTKMTETVKSNNDEIKSLLTHLESTPQFDPPQVFIDANDWVLDCLKTPGWLLTFSKRHRTRCEQSAKRLVCRAQEETYNVDKISAIQSQLNKTEELNTKIAELVKENHEFA